LSASKIALILIVDGDSPAPKCRSNEFKEENAGRCEVDSSKIYIATVRYGPTSAHTASGLKF